MARPLPDPRAGHPQRGFEDIAPEVPLTILVRDDTPWWIIARAVHDNSFPLRGEFMKVSVTRDPGNAGMVLHPDCTVSAR